MMMTTKMTDQEEDDSTVITTAIEENDDDNKRKKIKLYLVGVVIFVSLLLLAIVLDLVIKPVKDAQVNSINVDVRNPGPEAGIDFSLEYGSWFSSIAPVGMHCTLDSGDVEFDVSKIEDDQDEEASIKPERYLVRVTCPEEDIESHAALLWQLLTRKDNDATLQGLMESGSCEMTVTVRFGHILPLTHTVEMPLEKLVSMGPKDDEEDVETDDDKDGSSDGLPVNVCSIDKQSLDICIPLDGHSTSRLPSIVTLQLPSIKIFAQPLHTAGMVISMNAWDAIFDPFKTTQEDKETEEEEEGDASNTALISISSRDDLLPFYRPLIDLFLVNEDETAISITVDGEGSFLEILLGQHHSFNIKNYDQAAEVTFVKQDDDQKRLLGPTAEFQSGYKTAAAHCMSVNVDDSEAFDFGLCWLLDIAQKEVTLVGNLTVYDTSLSTYSETTWTTETDYFKIDMGGAVFIVDEDNLMELVGEFVIDFRDTTNIDFDISVENIGSLWPFSAKLLTTGSTEQIKLDLTIDEVTFVWDGEGVDQAQGTMTFDWGEAFSENFIMEARLDHGSQDVFDAELTMDTTQEETWLMAGSTACNWDTEDIWDATMAFVIDTSDDGSNDEGHMTATIKETVSTREYVFYGSAETEDDEDVIINGAYVHTIEETGEEDSLAMRLALLYNEAENFVMRIGSNYTRGFEDLCTAVMTISLDDDEAENRSYMKIEVSELQSEYEMSISSTVQGEEGDEGEDLTMTTDIAFDDNGLISIEGSFRVNGEQDLVIKGTSECNWDGDDVWGTNMEFILDMEEDTYASYMGLVITEEQSGFHMSIDNNMARPDDDTLTLDTEIVFDENEDLITLQVQILDGNDDDTEIDFNLSATSTGMWNSDSIWDSDLSVTWDYDDDTDTGEMAASINEQQSDFTMSSAVSHTPTFDVITDDLLVFNIELQSFLIEVEDEVYADSFGNVKVDIENSLVLIDLEDEGKMDFVAGIDFEWFSIGGKIDKIEISRKTCPDVYFSGAAIFEASSESTSLGLNVEMPRIDRNLDAEIRYDLEEDPDTFTLQIARIHFYGDSESYVDLTSRVVIGLVEDPWIELSAGDAADFDFNSNFTARISSGTTLTENSWEAEVERLFLRSGSETYIDMNMAMDMSQDDTNGDFEMGMTSSTTEDSELRMDMDISMTWSDDEQALKMSSDHMVVGWKETLFLEMPINTDQQLLIPGPTNPPPTPFPSLEDSSPSPSPEDSNQGQSKKSFTFKGTTIRLEGMPKLTDKSKSAFEEGTEAFYNDLYAPKTDRHLEIDASSLTFFETVVIVTGDEPDETGNTITYDQNVTFTTTSNVTAEEKAAQDLLVSPLETDTSKDDYLNELKERDDDFATVSKVSTPAVTVSDPEEKKKEPVEEPEDDGLSVGAIVGIVVAGVFGLCCGCATVFFCMKKENSDSLDKTRDMDEGLLWSNDEETPSANTPSLDDDEDDEDSDEYDEDDSDDWEDDEESSAEEEESYDEEFDSDEDFQGEDDSEEESTDDGD